MTETAVGAFQVGASLFALICVLLARPVERRLYRRALLRGLARALSEPPPESH